jgi:excisionase family DNA binding protein
LLCSYEIIIIVDDDAPACQGFWAEEERGMKEKTMTTRQAAAALGVSIRHILTLLYEGKLPAARKVGMMWQIPTEAIQRRLTQARGAK